MKTMIIEENNDYNAVPTCKLQVINDKTMRWETLAEIPDTPRYVEQALKELNSQDLVWKRDCLGDRTLLN